MYGVGQYIKETEKRERLLRDKQASDASYGTKEDKPNDGPDDRGEVAGATKRVRDRDKE